MKGYYLSVALVTGIAFLLHLVRSIMGWDLILGPWAIPIWLSWILFVLAGIISYKSFRLIVKK